MLVLSLGLDVLKDSIKSLALTTSVEGPQHEKVENHWAYVCRSRKNVSISVSNISVSVSVSDLNQRSRSQLDLQKSLEGLGLEVSILTSRSGNETSRLHPCWRQGFSRREVTGRHDF